MKLSQFKFKLPEEKIALHPVKYRDEVPADGSTQVYWSDRTCYIQGHPELFDDQDAFIFNDTKSIPCPFVWKQGKDRARIEVFLLRELNEELRLWGRTGGSCT